MSFRSLRRLSLRRVLAGSLVTAFLTLGSPVSGQAAHLFASPDVSSFWALAWQWLVAQISPAEEAAAATSAKDAAVSGSDAGWTLDPDG